MIKKIALLTALGVVSADDPSPDPPIDLDLDVFANKIFDMSNELDASDIDLEKVPNHSDKYTELLNKQEKGELVGSDAFKTLDELSAAQGFTTESHTVTTSDGYILTIYRIPGTTAGKKADKPPIIL